MKAYNKIIAIAAAAVAATLLSGCVGLGWSVSEGFDGTPSVGVSYTPGPYFNPTPPPPPGPRPMGPGGPMGPWFVDQP